MNGNGNGICMKASKLASFRTVYVCALCVKVRFIKLSSVDFFLASFFFVLAFIREKDV